MAKVSKSFRIDETVNKQLIELEKYLQNQLNHFADMSLTSPQKATTTQALEFAINYCYQKLKHEGDI